jgi:hypothetical protein
MDWIPIVSQVKSLVQVICNDAEGAKKTQENFSKTCPIVSQCRSACEVAFCEDGARKARETQLAQVGMISDFADGIPVLGHVKGTIHYICKDSVGGEKAMKASSRTVGVIGGGVGGFLFGGPAGAIAGGIGGGLFLDGITTGVHSDRKRI